VSLSPRTAKRPEPRPAGRGPGSCRGDRLEHPGRGLGSVRGPASGDSPEVMAWAMGVSQPSRPPAPVGQRPPPRRPLWGTRDGRGAVASGATRTPRARVTSRTQGAAGPGGARESPPDGVGARQGPAAAPHRPAHRPRTRACACALGTVEGQAVASSVAPARARAGPAARRPGHANGAGPTAVCQGGVRTPPQPGGRAASAPPRGWSRGGSDLGWRRAE
jgi:hypothetical protein